MAIYGHDPGVLFPNYSESLLNCPVIQLGQVKELLWIRLSKLPANMCQYILGSRRLREQDENRDRVGGRVFKIQLSLLRRS